MCVELLDKVKVAKHLSLFVDICKWFSGASKGLFVVSLFISSISNTSLFINCLLTDWLSLRT